MMKSSEWNTTQPSWFGIIQSTNQTHKTEKHDSFQSAQNACETRKKNHIRSLQKLPQGVWTNQKRATLLVRWNNKSGADIWLIFGVTLIDCNIHSCSCSWHIRSFFCLISRSYTFRVVCLDGNSFHMRSKSKRREKRIWEIERPHTA